MQRTLCLILRIYESFPEALQKILLRSLWPNWVICPFLSELQARGPELPWSAREGWILDRDLCLGPGLLLNRPGLNTRPKETHPWPWLSHWHSCCKKIELRGREPEGVGSYSYEWQNTWLNSLHWSCWGPPSHLSHTFPGICLLSFSLTSIRLLIINPLCLSW